VLVARPGCGAAESRQIGGYELEDLLWTTEVFEVVFAHVTQRVLLRQIIRDQIVSGLREQGLPTVAKRKDAGDAVERRAEVVASAFLRHTAVERHAHPQWSGRAPRFGVQPALRSQGSF
jgi:hypothetical protein